MTTLNTNSRLKVLSKWLKDADFWTVGFDSEHSGSLERAIAQAQVDTMCQIGDKIEEVLNMDDESIMNQLT